MVHGPLTGHRVATTPGWMSVPWVATIMGCAALECVMSYLDDPRVLFATERTLLAWNRTAISLMGFGFLVERFGLFIRVVLGHPEEPLHRHASLIIGVSFILLGVALLVLSVRQYRLVVRTLGSEEIPSGYWVNAGVLVNVALALLGLVLAAYIALM